MPKGPSIVILREAVEMFKGKKVIEVSGNSKMPIQQIKDQLVMNFLSWGKHFLIVFKTFAVRIHFMLFGSYLINDEKETKPRLSLRFNNGVINFYACSVKFIEEKLDEVYDWSCDVMSPLWDPDNAKRKLKANPAMMVCDALLDQNIFSGVGNIIKNEVLFRIKVDPRSIISKMPLKKINEMIRETRKYCFQFLEWKKAYVLKKHWLAHTKKICPRDNVPFTKKHLGKTNRRTFFCTSCQILYA